MDTWVFLRGLTRETAHWGSFPEKFQKRFPESQIIALDLPGNGLLHRQQSPRTVGAMADACREALARRGVSGPVHLLAMSLGAMVAIEWARTAPAEVAGCVLINTSVRPFSPFYRRLLPRNYLGLLKLATPSLSVEAVEHGILRMTSNHAEQHRRVLPDWVKVRLQRPVSRANALRQLTAAARFLAPTTAPAPPVLLLTSQQDHLVDSRCSVALARAWNCQLAVHPDAGHDLPLDAPQWVATQVQQWMHQTASGARPPF